MGTLLPTVRACLRLGALARRGACLQSPYSVAVAGRGSLAHHCGRSVDSEVQWESSPGWQTPPTPLYPVAHLQSLSPLPGKKPSWAERVGLRTSIRHVPQNTTPCPLTGGDSAATPLHSAAAFLFDTIRTDRHSIPQLQGLGQVL